MSNKWKPKRRKAAKLMAEIYTDAPPEKRLEAIVKALREQFPQNGIVGIPIKEDGDTRVDLIRVNPLLGDYDWWYNRLTSKLN